MSKVAVKGNTLGNAVFTIESPPTDSDRTFVLPDNEGTIITTADIGTIASQDSDNVSISGGTIGGITDLAVEDGGTGASNDSDARVNLGLGDVDNVSAADLRDRSTHTGTQDATTVDYDNASSGLAATDVQAAIDEVDAEKVPQTSETGAAEIPSGTTAERPANPVAGMIRFNTDEGYFEGYDPVSDAWSPVYQEPPFFATGGTETTITEGGVDYKVHTFTSSGTFEVTQGEGEVEYLVVAGGGSGGDQGENATFGGGGAGGYRSSVSGELSGRNSPEESPLQLTLGSYSVVVGGGGSSYSSGTNSSFSSITSLGGGHGGGGGNTPAADGGSGGGAGQGTPGASGTAGQGFDGGGGSGRGAGGGGASQDGEDSNTDNGGDGGDGISSSITGTAVTRAGGGGGGSSSAAGDTGGTGGAGGGGKGESSDSGDATAGDANTGGGGGGSFLTGSKPGGSGIVIIRYPI